MTLTTNQRKCLWLAVIAAAVYYVPSIVTMATQPAIGRQAAQAPRVQTPPLVPVNPFRDLFGQYSGRAILARGNCTFQLEIRDNREKPGLFSGYTSLTCVPAVRMGWYAYTGVRPTAAILTGTADGDAIKFMVDDTVSGSCPPKAVTAKRFGSNAIAVEWDDPCKGGKMLLSRTGR